MENETSFSDYRERYGGFWIRFAAFLVDLVILLIPSLLVSFLLRSVTQANHATDKRVVEFVDNGLQLAIWWVYTAGMLSSSWQATIGKRVCELKVTDYDGRRISFGRATWRCLASLLSALLLCLGFLMIAWTKRRQGLHDFMANTLVAKNKQP
ncbi:RDD family protein [Fontisphaera persica]|uniref:RDD family protein n=1 Tax=Fontisphaera persica TaxID=2974023 RepID=UPI0024BF3730|nr:RDD family protein [Fontisphaera persica]WCJ58753.1 RDD family protein [Fontisphaera persica]